MVLSRTLALAMACQREEARGLVEGEGEVERSLTRPPTKTRQAARRPHVLRQSVIIAPPSKIDARGAFLCAKAGEVKAKAEPGRNF